MVWMLGSRCIQLVDGSVCCKLLAESADTPWSYVIDRTDDMNSGGLNTERTECFWMQVIIHRNGMLAVNNHCMKIVQYHCTPNDCWYVSMVSVNGASRILVSSFAQSKGCIVTSIQRGVIGRLKMLNGQWHACWQILDMSINRVSPISSHASWIITGLCVSVTLWSQYWLPWWAQRPATIMVPTPKNERQPSVNNFWPGILDNSRAVQWHMPIITILAVCIGKNASANIPTNT